MEREKRQEWLDAVKQQLPDKYKLRQAWMNWIEKYKPDLWVTVTFREQDKVGWAKKKFIIQNAEKKFFLENDEEIAVRRIKQFLKHLNARRFAFYDKYILCFMAIEKNPSGKGVHIHALIKGIKPELASRLERRCHYAFGISKVVPFDYSIRPYSAIDYITDKYIFFKTDNLMFYKINSKYRGKNGKGDNKTGSDCTSNPPLNQGAVVLEEEQRAEPPSTKVKLETGGIENLFYQKIM